MQKQPTREELKKAQIDELHKVSFDLYKAKKQREQMDKQIDGYDARLSELAGIIATFEAIERSEAYEKTLQEEADKES